MKNTSEITMLLQAMSDGKSSSFDRLIPLVYDEMQHMARRQLGGHGGATLNTNALVHEAFLKLSAGQEQGIGNRNQFLAVCSVVMRNVVIDAVRRRQAVKRGGKADPLTFNEELFETDNQAEELMALNEALNRLEEYDSNLARVVECRYFAGLTELETAGALEIGERTVRRRWTKARALLHQMLTS